MINIKHAQTKQLTVNGEDGDWVASLDGEELYRLPAYITVQDTFVIRDIILKMMKLAENETKSACDAKIKEITARGQMQLDVLKAENERLATALEQHMLLNEEAI